MKLHSIRGGNESDLLNKKYNIGVGISLGNKWFTPDNIVGAVKWSLQYTRQNVIVYVADSIHAINLEVRNRVSFEKAEKKADQMGDDILHKTKIKLIEELSPSEMGKVKFVKWNQIIDESYKSKLVFIYDMYKHNDVFRNDIISIVKIGISKEKRTFNEQDINRLGDYLIAEIPELLNRVNMAGSQCDAYAYPFDAEIAVFVEKIQKGQIYPEIKFKIMDTEPKVFLEVR